MPPAQAAQRAFDATASLFQALRCRPPGAVPLLEMTDADRQSVVIVNLRGTFLGCREAAKQMVRRPARADPRRDQTDRSGGRITAPFTALVEGRRSQRTDYRHRARR
jgi:NAD(P)-dependent dehydrogenase (short-subunit alcohol dehydrogenase family)